MAGCIGLIILIILVIINLDSIKYYCTCVCVKKLKRQISHEAKKIENVHRDLEELKSNNEVGKLKILGKKREKKIIERRFDEYIKCYNDKYIQYYKFCIENGIEASDEFIEIDVMIDDIESEFKPKKALERELKLVTKKYDICYSLVNSSGEKLFKTKMDAIKIIDKSVSLINSIAKHPKNFDTDVEQIVVHKGMFKDALDYAKEQKEDLKKSAKGIGIGVIAGGTFATIAPSTAMWVATTFGTASTGTAISALSGSVATNAALAWLGGGAVAAGGGGVAAGQALLALAGPIGWGIAGTSVLASVLIVVRKRFKQLKSIKDDIIQIQNCTYSIKKLIGEMDEISLKIKSMSPELSSQIKKCKKLRGKEYSKFTNKDREILCAVVNNTKSLSFLITKSIGEEGE